MLGGHQASDNINTRLTLSAAGMYQVLQVLRRIVASVKNEHEMAGITMQTRDPIYQSGHRFGKKPRIVTIPPVD